MIDKTLKFSKSFLCIVLFSVIYNFSIPVSYASLVYKMTPAQLTKQANEVRMGEVISTWTSPDPVNKMIYTYVKLRIDETYKGKKKSELLLRQPGGKYTHANGQTYRTQVFGMESFHKGEKGIFFIQYAKDGAPNVMFQGKRTIVKDPTSGRQQAKHVLSKDIEYVDQNLKTVKNSSSLYAKEEMQSLSDLIAEINNAVGK